MTGNERWDDRSWNRDRDHGDSRDWDNGSNNRYRDRSYEDDYEAEKDDREDSDTESNHNYTAAPKKYRDTDNNSPTISEKEKRVNLNINPAITKSPAKTTQKVLKKVDLGAAANFGRGQMQSPNPSAGDLLNDDFNPRGESEKVEKTVAEFGDFETAFGGSQPQKSDDHDDFADFSSAFHQQQQQTPHNLPIQQQFTPNFPLQTPQNLPLNPPTNFTIQTPQNLPLNPLTSFPIQSPPQHTPQGFPLQSPPQVTPQGFPLQSPPQATPQGFPLATPPLQPPTNFPLQSPGQATPQSSASQNLLGGIAPNLLNMNAPPPAGGRVNVNDDLLGGLGSLSLQGSQSFGGQSQGSLLDGFDSG